MHKLKITSILSIVFIVGMLLPSVAQTSGTYFLNGSWSFKIDPQQRGEQLKWYQPTINTCSWDSLKVPGNWDLENRYAEYSGLAWYRRSFIAPAQWRDSTLQLVFESVAHDAKVWLNGKLLGENHYGFLPFSFNISNLVRLGEKNSIVVEVDNTFKRGALWNWGGIRRPVMINVKAPQHLDYQHITAIPDLEKGNSSINIKTFLVNNAAQNKEVDIKYELFYKGKLIRQQWQRNLKLSSNDTTTAAADFSLDKKQTKLWDFDHPRLYDSKITLYHNGQILDSLTDHFGIRKITVEGYDLKLNGEVIRPVGFNLVPDDRTTGNTLPLWRIKKDVDMMKSLGANMMRISHVPLPKAFLDYLDEKGIMVFSEVSLWGKDRMVDPDNPYPKEWLNRLVKYQYNHPSVIGWSVGNEIGYKYKNPKAMAYVKSAIEHVHQLDTNRLAVYVSNSAQSQAVDPVQYEKLILLNAYGNWGQRADEADSLHPGKPIFFSEYGQGIIDEDPNKGIIAAQHMLDDMRGRKYLIGCSLWTFDDYRSNFVGTGPSENRAWGVVNVFRRPKRAFKAFQKAYAPVKALEVALVQQKLTIKISPRKVLDIPAYTLNGYTLVWSLESEDNHVLDGGFSELPEIKPGDDDFQKNISINTTMDSCAKLTVSFISPEMYDVLDTTIYLRKPSSPKIKAIYTSLNSIRICYQKVPLAQSYQLIYNNGSVYDTTAKSIDDFIEVDHLEAEKKYTFRLIACNGKGYSKPSSSVSGIENEDELPPVIWKTVPADHAFFVGYSVKPEDFLYDIQYGTSPHHYDHRLVLKNRGVLKVPNLENGQTYYFKLRSRNHWGFASEWSPEYSVIPDGGMKPPVPEVKGFVCKGNTAILFFDPVPKAIAYELLIRNNGHLKKRIAINAADIHYYILNHISNDDDVFLRAKTENGYSREVRVH